MERRGITKLLEYALLTNEIYKGWSNMTDTEEDCLTNVLMNLYR